MATRVWTPYTNNPTEALAVIFPDHGMQLLDNLVHYLGITILTYCFAARSYNEDLLSLRGWLNMSWPRLTILLTFFFSWVFIFTSGVLVNGIGMSYSARACQMGIYACIIFYALTKIFIYSFLAERVYVVWASGNKPPPRFKSPIYRLCLFVMSGYLAIFVILVIGQISEFRSDGVCIIGLKHFASVAILSYDLIINVFLTSMFVYPLVRHGFINPRLRSVATKTLVAAIGALTTSSVNVAILTIMHGRQLGWVCLASCGTDVTLNALVLFWVTSRGARDTPLTPALAVIAASPQNNAQLSAAHSHSEQDKHVPRRTPSHVYHGQSDASTGGEAVEERLTRADVYRSETYRQGVAGWLGRLRHGNGETPSMEVQVTVLTEMELEENPEHKFEGSSQLTEDQEFAKSIQLSDSSRRP